MHDMNQEANNSLMMNLAVLIFYCSIYLVIRTLIAPGLTSSGRRFDLSWNQINSFWDRTVTPTASTITGKRDDIFQFRRVREFPWNGAITARRV